MTPTIGEVMQNSRRDGLRSIVIALAGLMIAVGLVYTGVHNYNLFGKVLPSDQRVFALIPVALLEGSVALFLIGSFVWFSIGTQKLLSAAFSWALFGIVAFNTLVDSTIHTQGAGPLPDWLNVYATFMLPVTPVLVVAMWKIIIDTDPTRRRLDMERTLAEAQREAMYQAAQHALTSGEATRAALAEYARTYEDAVARLIRDSAPQVTPASRNGHRPDTITLAADAPPIKRPKASKGMNGEDRAQAGPSGA